MVGLVAEFASGPMNFFSNLVSTFRMYCMPERREETTQIWGLELNSKIS